MKNNFYIKLSFRNIFISLLTILSLFGSNIVFSQFINDDSSLIYESPNDSLDLTSKYFDATDSAGIYFFTGIDSVNYPILTLSYDSITKAYGGSWSNEVLFLYDTDFDPSKMEDSIRVVLQDDKGHCYYQPFPGYVSSGFGWRWRQYHYGVDINLHYGDTIRCAFDGVVRIAKYGWGYGNCVVVRHMNGIETLYGHMSVLKVVPNQVVKAGDILGLGGCTGKCYGPHLHFEIRYLGIAIDPTSLIDFQNYYVLKDTIYLSKKDFQYLNNFKKISTVGATYNTGTTPYTGGATYYTVKSGDTLSKIARCYGTTVSAICALNGIYSGSILSIGKTLRVK